MENLKEASKSKKSITYQDIAKKTNSSIGTISRYFNGGYVSSKKKQIIEQVVNELNYYPNHGARLIKGRDTTIFVIVPSWYENSITQIINGIDQDAKKRKLKVVITYASNETEDYIETIKYVLAWKPFGIVLFLPKVNNNVIDYLVKNPIQIPTLIFGHKVPGYNNVLIDTRSAFTRLVMLYSKFVETSQKILLTLDTKLNLNELNARKNGFVDACLKKKLDYEIYNFNSKDADESKQLYDKIIKEGITNIICSTHDSYILLVSSGIKNLRLTDIGYSSIYDRPQRYKGKIFIDYTYIGIFINRILQDYVKDKTPKSKFYVPEVVVD